MLRRLSGKAHQVLTGVSLRQGAYEVGRVETTSVVFPRADRRRHLLVCRERGRAR